MVNGLENLTKEEIEYFKKIDKRLREFKAYHTEFYGGVGVDDYKNSKLENGEMQKILDLTMKKKDIVFYPVNTAMGFAVGFQFLKWELGESKKKSELLLRFRESQLPEGYTFQNLSSFFMRKENVKKAEYLGEEVVNDRDHYDY